MKRSPSSNQGHAKDTCGMPCSDDWHRIGKSISPFDYIWFRQRLHFNPLFPAMFFTQNLQSHWIYVDLFHSFDCYSSSFYRVFFFLLFLFIKILFPVDIFLIYSHTFHAGFHALILLSNAFPLFSFLSFVFRWLFIFVFYNHGYIYYPLLSFYSIFLPPVTIAGRFANKFVLQLIWIDFRLYLDDFNSFRQFVHFRSSH